MAITDLSADELELFVSIGSANDGRVAELISQGNVRVDCADEHGMTPLAHASFKANMPIVRLLLEHGADVNTMEHKEGYTPLMFAALAGSGDVCHALLEAGAHTHRTNKLHKSAMEMAAFTGQHHCVSIINNFVAQDDVEKIINPRGSTDPPRLPAECAPLLHDLSRTYNVHPVRTLLYMLDHEILLEDDHRRQVLWVFDRLFEANMHGKAPNEVMAFKLHIIHMTLKDAFASIDKQRKNDERDGAKEPLPMEQMINCYIRHLLMTPAIDAQLQVDTVVRQYVTKWPYPQSALWQTVVRQLQQSPTASAMNIVQQMVIGNRAVIDAVFCGTCGEPHSTKRCASCRAVTYCSPRCQRLHWFVHKKCCSTMKAAYERALVEREAEERVEASKRLGDISDELRAVNEHVTNGTQNAQTTC